MDALSAELQQFLIRLGSRPESVSHKVTHYIEHLLHLLDAGDEHTIIEYYGLFGHQTMPLDFLARQRDIAPSRMLGIIESCLRRIAVTPEWQMIRQTLA